MKLHNTNTNKDSYILSSNDVLVTGEVNDNLTNVINNQEEKLNSLEQNVKWLYKYGGTGSKGGGGSYTPTTNLNLNSSILFGTTIIKDSGNQRVILSNKNATSETLSIKLTQSNVLNTYYVRVNHGGYIMNPSTGKAWWSLNMDNEYSVSMQISLAESHNIIIDLQGTSSLGDTLNKQYVFEYIKNPYVISLSLIDNAGKDAVISNNLYTNNARSSGVNLKIDYNVASAKKIAYSIADGGVNMMSEYQGYINEAESGVGIGQVVIPFSSEFINSEDNYGTHTINVKFTIDPDESLGIMNAQILTYNISFTYIPANEKFFKVEPQNSNAKIYKYSENSYQQAEIIFEEYKRYFNLLNTLEKEDALPVEIKQQLINELELNESASNDQIKAALNSKLNELNTSLYIFGLGSLSLYIQAYDGADVLGTTDVKYICTKEDDLSNIDPIELESSLQLRKRQLINIPIHEEGIYKISIFSQSQKVNQRIYYYFAVFNKNSNINWFSSDINFNQIDLYYRNGEIGSNAGTDISYIEQYREKTKIQKYANGNTSILFDINDFVTDNNRFSNSACDVMFSVGLQYSYINNSKNKIMSLMTQSASSNLNINVYQNKINLAQSNADDASLANIYIPKEHNYSPNTNDNYHLLTFYKRYIYETTAPYYEICIYLDGCLEGAFKTFMQDSSVWSKVILYNSNYAINFFELSYINHNKESVSRFKTENNNVTLYNISYLDDISIAEYWYKYASIFKSNSILNGDIPSFSKVEKILNNLRNFKETEYGMIEVAESNDITNIAKEIDVPVLWFKYTDKSKNDFINWFTTSYPEDALTSDRKDLTELYYSSGKNNAGLQQIGIPSDLGSESCWYLKLQGSSTGKYFDKNLTLGLKTQNQGMMGIFTPNFYDLDQNIFNISEPTAEEQAEINKAKTSFLPETAFTLKADIVDSTHSNNTTVGAFVNANTTPFDISFDGGNTSKANNKYVNYIKNCLLGFPVLIFASTTYQGVTKHFFLGIYNFNLGRDSYFNMGYYSPSVLLNQSQVNESLTNADGNTFIVSYVTYTNTEASSLEVSDGVIVAEIQGGSSYYDFSQYDESILLPIADSDLEGMFGDFVPKYNPGKSDNATNRILFHLPRFVKAVAKAGGYIFDNLLHKHLGEYKYKYNKYIDKGPGSSIFDSANQVPNYKIQYKRSYPQSNPDLQFLINNFRLNPDGSYILDENDQPILIDQNVSAESLYELIDPSTDPNSPSIDARGLNPILDYKSVSEYYTVCMAFGLVDSVMKNLNVKTWTGTYSGNAAVDNKTGKWYIAFYDMDTSLSRDNGGSKTSYFAFSDYWRTNKSTKLEMPTVYRDFYPAKDEDNEYVAGQSLAESGYDVPSSYLFAIAKYSHFVYGDQFESSMIPYIPNNIWTRWRYKGETIENIKGPGLGELQDADYFIKKYFIRNLDNIPEQLWTMNYRFKYLKRIVLDPTVEYIYKYDTSENSTFEAENFKPFHGKGIYELNEWLSGRLHILDSYFNLEKYQGLGLTALRYEVNKDENDNPLPAFTPIIIHDELKGYKYQDNESPVKDSEGHYIWDTLDGLFEYYPPVNSINQNKDIEILKDMFSMSYDKARYAQPIVLDIRAQDFSPFNIVNHRGAVTGKYLIESSDKKYHITYDVTGLQDVKFGGSTLWTDIENLNTVLSAQQDSNLATLTLNSDKLERIVLTKGQCGSYNIKNMKSLKTVYIAKDINDQDSVFSGTLTFSVDLDNYDPYPDLTSIDLIRTTITLVVYKEGVKTINLTGTKSGENSIIGCENLESVTLDNFSASSLTITPGWSNNVVITNSKIEKIKISPKNKNDETRSIHIKNDTVLNSIVLEDFTHITLEGCSNLSNICILKPELVVSLNIINCNTYLNNENSKGLGNLLNICTNEDDLNNSTTPEGDEHTLNLEAFINIKSFKFTGTKGFTKVDVKESRGEDITININGISTEVNVIRLFSEAFQNTDLNQIILKDNTYLYIDSDRGGATATFANSEYGKNTLRNNIIIGKNVTNLDSMFKHDIGYLRVNSVIDRQFAKDFLEGTNGIIYEDISKITSMDSLFYGQGNISVNNISNRISLANFVNVQNISYIFFNTSIQLMDKSWFGLDDTQYCGKNVIDAGNEFKMDCFCTMGLTQISVNIFDYYINNVKTLISNIENIAYGFKILDVSLDSEFKIINLFSKLRSDNIIEEFKGFNIDKQHKINWTDLLWDSTNNCPRFPNLKTIYGSFNNDNVDSINYNKIGLDKVTSLERLENSFNFSTKSKEKYNIKSFIDFDSILENSNYKLPYLSGNFKGAKEINEADIIPILKKLSNGGCTNISYLFENTTIFADNSKSNINELVLSDSSVSQYEFRICSYLFNNAAFIDKNTNEKYGFEITQDTLKAFTNVYDWSYAFCNTTLHKNLPLNMFNLKIGTDYLAAPTNNYKNIISNLEAMFSNVKIDSNVTWFEYDWNNNWTYNGGVKLNGSYHSEIDTLYKPKLSNPLSKDVTIRQDEQNVDISYYGEHIIHNLILPWDIFYGCTRTANITNFISNSEFEGILPSLLFKGIASELTINNAFKNVLVIPNYVDDYVINIKTTLNGEKSYYLMAPAYVFVPKNFTATPYLTNAFTFKLLLPNSGYAVPDKLTLDENDNYAGTKLVQVQPNNVESYFIFQNDSIQIGKAESIKNMMPVNETYVYYDINGNQQKRALHLVDTTLPYNNGLIINGMTDIGFNARHDYQIHLYMYLNENDFVNKGLDTWTEIDDTETPGLYKSIDSTATGLPLSGNVKLMKQTIYNTSILTFVYGSIMNSFNLTDLGVPDTSSEYIMQLVEEWSDFSYNIILPQNGDSDRWYEKALTVDLTYTKNLNVRNVSGRDPQQITNYQNCVPNGRLGID